MASESKPETEYKVIVPANPDKKRYTIMMFNGALNVDPGTWTRQTIEMSREDNRAKTMGTSEIKQDYGAGSEYGRAQREEQKRKRMGYQSRTYHHDRQPWQLVITDNNAPSAASTSNGDSTEVANDGSDGVKKERIYGSHREGGAGEHSDYWTGNNFHAHKVDDWYRFRPNLRHRTLDIDQAEEQFQHRNKVLNQFALKAQIQQSLKEQDEDGAKVAKSTRTLKIKDEGSDDDEEEANDDDTPKVGDAGDDVRNKTAGGKKKKGNAREQRDKKQRVKNADEIAAYESEDGEEEGREQDYMSDSGSDTSREEITVEEKMDRDLVAVGDEKGLRDESSDDSSSDEDADDDAGNKDEQAESKRKLLKRLRAQQAATGTATGVDVSSGGKTAADGDDANAAVALAGRTVRLTDTVDERDSSGSDTDDPDSPKSKSSVLFMQLKDRKRAAAAATAGDDDDATANGAAVVGPSDAKRIKTGKSREATPAAAAAAATSRDGSRATSPAVVVDGALAISTAAASAAAVTATTTAVSSTAAAAATAPSTSSNADQDRLDEPTVRRLLSRREHTTKELLSKLKPYCNGLKQQEVVARLADILRAIGPHQTRRTVNRKEVLFFSLKPL